jgi:hypothetical protein
MTSDDDISFSNSSIEEEIDIDTIDESGVKKAAKKSKSDTLAITGLPEAIALPESESSGEEGVVRRKESPLIKFKALVDKYNRRSAVIKEQIKNLEHPNSKDGKGRKVKLDADQTTLVKRYNAELNRSERKRAKAITLFEAEKRANLFVPDSAALAPAAAIASAASRQSQRLLSNHPSPSSQALDVSTLQLLEQNQNLTTENFNRTAALVELTNQHQQQQQQAIQQIVGPELQRQQEQQQAGQQIALLTAATIEAQNLAQGAQNAIASISAEKAALATQGTVVYSEATRHIAGLNNQISELQEANKTLKDELQKAIGESASWKVSCFEATKHSQGKERDLETAKSSYSTLLTNYKTLEQNYNSIQSAVNSKGVEIEEKSKQIEGLQQRIVELANSSDSSDRKNSVKLQQTLSRVAQLEAEKTVQEDFFNQELLKLRTSIESKEDLIKTQASTLNNLDVEYKKIVVLKDKLETLIDQNLKTHELQLQNSEINYNESINKYKHNIEILNNDISLLKSQNKEQEKEILNFRSIEYMSKGLLTSVLQRPAAMNTNIPSANLASELTELVSIPIRQELRKFSGTGGERVQAWFSKSEAIARGAGWTPQLMRRYFAARFTGPAAAYQEQIDKERRLIDYEEWKKDIIEQFKDPNETIKFRRELTDIKQRDDERVKDFKARIIKLFTKGYGDKAFKSTDAEMTAMREDVLKKALNDGLREDIASGYWNRVRGDASFDEAATTANEVEKVQLAKKATPGPAVNGVINTLIQNQKQVCTNLNLITDKVQQLAIDRKPESAQLNYIEKRQQSQSPSRQFEANGRPKPIDTQRGRNDLSRKVRFDQRIPPSGQVRAGNGTPYRPTYPNTSINRYAIRNPRNLGGNRPQPGVHGQRGGITRDGKPNFKSPSERLCFGCGSRFHFISKCPAKQRQNSQFPIREWIPRKMN